LPHPIHFSNVSPSGIVQPVGEKVPGELAEALARDTIVAGLVCHLLHHCLFLGVGLLLVFATARAKLLSVMAHPPGNQPAA
jgi:hypothetical protein